MSIKIVYGANNIPDTAKAVETLVSAYNSGKESEISEALEVVNATVDEANRIKRRDFYLSCVDESDVVATRKAILTAGYIPQIRLVNRANKSGREIHIDTSECQIDITEVNRLVRKDIFAEDIVYKTMKFRNAIVAYVANEMGKSLPEVENAIGYNAVKYLNNAKTSMNNMQKLLQDVADEILFVNNGEDKNEILLKKSDVKAVAFWVATKSTRYGTKFGSSETVLRMIVDIIWAKLNDKTLEMQMDKIKF